MQPGKAVRPIQLTHTAPVLSVEGAISTGAGAACSAVGSEHNVPAGCIASGAIGCAGEAAAGIDVCKQQPCNARLCCGTALIAKCLLSKLSHWQQCCSVLHTPASAAHQLQLTWGDAYTAC